MKIAVRVKTQARADRIQQSGDAYVVEVKALPIDGKANRAVERVIAQHFKVPSSRVRVVSGHRMRVKRVEIL